MYKFIMGSLFSPQRGLLGDAVFAAALYLFSTVWAVSQEIDIFRPTTAAELIASIEQANASPDRLALINLTGTYEFTEIYVQANAKGNTTMDSVTPSMVGNVTFNIKNADLKYNPLLNDPSATSVAALQSNNAGRFIAVLFNLVPEQKAAFGKTNLPANFEGFDTIIDATDSVVVINGARANCRNCIQATDSRIIVANSDLRCLGRCIENFVGSMTTNAGPMDFDGLRAALPGSGLAPAEITALLRQIDQSEELLSNHDVALVDSLLHALDLAMQIGTLGGPDVRVLVEKSYLETAGRQTGVLSLLNPAAGSMIKDSVVFNSNGFTTLEKTLRVESGDVMVTNSIIQQAGQRAITLRDGSITFRNSTIAVQPDSPEAVCVFSTGNSSVPESILSKGFNIATDASCGLEGPGDQQNTDPGLFFPTADFMSPADGDVIPRLLPGSPAIDGGPMAIEDNQLPCSVTDINGLPRPQDGNGNGSAECDVGPVELQGGVDIGARQSGAFFDVSRNGEGVFVEMLGAGKALTYLFSYTPQGDAFWAVGVGDVVGNGISIKKESFFTTRGAIFGPTFNPADVQLIPFADMAMSFPDCANTSKAGALAIDPNNTLGFPPLLSRTTRLTNVFSCNDGMPMGPGFSGSFRDPAHDGEGVIVEVTSPTSALMIWFTYDADGNQDWILGVGVIDGHTITVTDAFTQTGPKYGPAFDANDAVSTTWGNFSLTFDGGCNNAVLNYDSGITGFGAGSQNLARISNIEGLQCGL